MSMPAIAQPVYEPRPPATKRPLSRRRRQRSLAQTLARARLAAWCAVPLVLILLYVAGTADLTTQTYRLAAAQRLHATLAERNAALRSRVAELESVQNLQAVARKLHMTEPRSIAFLPLPSAGPPRPAPRVALFARFLGLTRWIGAR